MNRLRKAIKEATSLSDIPQYKHIPLDLTTNGKNKFLKKANLKDILSSTEYLARKKGKDGC